MINFWELDYRRLFRAYNDQLDFKAETAGLQEFSASDFTSSPVAVWDITDPLLSKHLTGVAVSGASSPYAARFRAEPAAGDRFWMQTESSFAAPASITWRSDTTWLRAPSVRRERRPRRRHSDYHAGLSALLPRKRLPRGIARMAAGRWS